MIIAEPVHSSNFANLDSSNILMNSSELECLEVNMAGSQQIKSNSAMVVNTDSGSTTLSTFSGKTSQMVMTLAKTRIQYVFENYFRNDRIASLYAELKNEILPNDWIPISRILRFRRVQAKLAGNIDVSVDIVANTLAESRFLEVSDDKMNVRRIKPFTEEDINNTCTISAHGFSKNTSLGDITIFFGNIGEVLNVMWVRSPNDPYFRGQVFVEFKSSQSAQQAVSTGKYKFQGRDIFVVYRRTTYAVTSNHKRKELNQLKETMMTNYVHDRVFKFYNADPSTSHTLIKHVFETKCAVSIEFVDYRRDETYGFVRLATGSAKEVCTKLDFKVNIAGEIVGLKVLDDDEEQNYWKVSSLSEVGSPKQFKRKAATVILSNRVHPYLSQKPFRTNDDGNRSRSNRPKKQKRSRKGGKKLSSNNVVERMVDEVEGMFDSLKVEERDVSRNNDEDDKMDVNDDSEI